MDFARIRLIAAIAGGVNACILIFVFAAPFWRTAEVAGSNLGSNVWAYQGLWTECVSLYNKKTQCSQIGDEEDTGNQGWRPSYNQYGIYAYLGTYRAFMIIAFLVGIAAFCFSLLGLKYIKVFREGSGAKRWMNIIAGICHFVAGVSVGSCVSWYAAEVVREYNSPYYQTTRLRYTIGACLVLGWIAMALSFAIGCVLTCCTCYNKPAAEDKGYYQPPISEIEVSSQPFGTVMMPQEAGSRYDDNDWDDGRTSRHTSSRKYYDDDDDRSSRYSSSRKSHKSHRSHRSHKSHRSEKKRSEWADDYDMEPNGYRDHRPEHDDGFV